MPLPLETRTYQKEHSIKIGSLLKASLQDFYRSRFLAKQLTVRDIKAQYRQSYLGMLWVVITPLTTAFVWIFLNSSGAIRLTDTGIPYPVYAFSGSLIWSILSEAINSPKGSTAASMGIMTKINFPKEALILSGIYKLLFNSAVKIVLLLVFLMVYQVDFGYSILLFPFALIGILLFGTSIGLLITPIALLYRDVSRIISLGMRFLMYVTPVVYVVPQTGVLKTLMELNPLTPLLVVSRNVVVGLPLDYLDYYLAIMLCCIPLFFVALLFYRVSIPIIVERSGG
ncbi:ABC transporter permease [Snuella lapsa]|uniref:ABC transporter permease n=1 Tax=Snuella lapsa TaxID=870481 RepID=A0ABP6XT98_9FLAO